MKGLNLNKRANQRGGIALAAVVSLAVVVTGTMLAYLTTATAETVRAKIHPARTQAAYKALGKLEQARMLIQASAYDVSGNLVLQAFKDGMIPEIGVEVVSMAGPDDPAGAFFQLRATGKHEGVSVTASQMVGERESFSSFLTLVGDANLGTSGYHDATYDPNNPSPLPPAPLSRGKIHTNGSLELFHSGYRHYLSPVTGSAETDWIYMAGAEAGKQIFWHPEESRPDAKQIAMPEVAAFNDVKTMLTGGTVTSVATSASWADSMVSRSDKGYLVNGDVNVLVELDGTNDTLSLTLRERTGSNRLATVTGLPYVAASSVLFVENGYDAATELTSPNQTVHIKGDLKQRLTIFAATGEARIAGSVRYLDASNRPAAVRNSGGYYVANSAYEGTASLGIITEFDVRYGIKPTTTTWPYTDLYRSSATGYEYGNLQGLAVGPRGRTTPVEENLFGYLGGATGDGDAEIHGAFFSRRGRIHSDGLNTLNYENEDRIPQIGVEYLSSGYEWISPWARENGSILRFGASVCNRRPVSNLVAWSPNRNAFVTVCGWGSGQSVFDENLALNAPPYYFRHNRPVFYDVEVSDLGGIN